MVGKYGVGWDIQKPQISATYQLRLGQPAALQ